MGDMKIVLDTSAFVAAIRSPSGAAAELLRLCLSGRLRSCASVPLFIEYEAVATRTEHLRAAGLAREEVLIVLDAWATVVERVDIRYLWRPQLRDPDDDMVLEAAVNGGASDIVTFNSRDFAGSARFGVRAMTPSETLALWGRN